MEKEKFRELVKNRINSEIKAEVEWDKKQKETQRYHRNQIILDLYNNIENKIKEYNLILSELFENLEMVLLDRNNFLISHRGEGEFILVLVVDKSKKSLSNSAAQLDYNALNHLYYTSQYDVFASFNVLLEHVPGTPSLYNIQSEYGVVAGHAVYESNSIIIDQNESNSEDIKKKIELFFTEFIDCFFQKGSFKSVKRK